MTEHFNHGAEGAEDLEKQAENTITDALFHAYSTKHGEVNWGLVHQEMVEEDDLNFLLNIDGLDRLIEQRGEEYVLGTLVELVARKTGNSITDYV